MDTNEKIKVLAGMRALGIKKLIPAGGSLSLTIPRAWAYLYCTEIEGDYYGQLDVEGDTLRFTAIDEAGIDKINVRERG